MARVPDTDDWAWRLSIADVVEDGPFSTLPGVDRWIAVATGSGMELSVDGIATRVTPPSGAFRFDGGATTTCRLLDGPVQDLNLMVRHGRATGSMEVLDLDVRLTVDDLSALVVLDGAVLFGEVELGPQDALVDARGTILPVGTARVALIRVG